MTVRGALTLTVGSTLAHGMKGPALNLSLAWKRGRLTNWTRAQARSLFHEAIEIGHLLIQGTERHVFALYSFSFEFFIELRVLAKIIDTELRNLGWSVSLGWSILEVFLTIGTWNALANRKPSVILAIAAASLILAISAVHWLMFPSVCWYRCQHLRCNLIGCLTNRVSFLWMLTFKSLPGHIP